MAEPEFTDTARAALLWVLWHHQGGSSPTGQAVRFALGIGQFDRLTTDQVAQAKVWAPGIPGLARTDPAGVMAARPMRPTPYGLAGIEGDAIVIRLTADACAFAFANDPQAREPRPPVINKRQFLRDTLNELTAEREDGSTPLTDMLDRAMVKAMENGSDALDHDATDGVQEVDRG